MCWVALLTPGPDQDEAAETIRGIQVLRGDPGRGWVELDPPDVIGLDDVVQFRARNALPVDPHRRLAAPDADGEATGGNVPQLKPPLGVGGDRSPQRSSAFDQGDLRLGYGRTGRILDGAGHLVGRCRRRWGPGGVLRRNR